MSAKIAPMSKLTPQMEKFCQGIADGLSQANAYRSAYPKSKAWKPETLHPQASKMMADHKVITRVAELRANLENKALWTREMSVKALVQAYKEGNASSKVAAVKELNAMHGYNAPTEINARLGGSLEVVRRIIDPKNVQT